jgi:hypothetical protein
MVREIHERKQSFLIRFILTQRCGMWKSSQPFWLTLYLVRLSTVNRILLNRMFALHLRVSHSVSVGIRSSLSARMLFAQEQPIVLLFPNLSGAVMHEYREYCSTFQDVEMMFHHSDLRRSLWSHSRIEWETFLSQLSIYWVTLHSRYMCDIITKGSPLSFT